MALVNSTYVRYGNDHGTAAPPLQSGAATFTNITVVSEDLVEIDEYALDLRGALYPMTAFRYKGGRDDESGIVPGATLRRLANGDHTLVVQDIDTAQTGLAEQAITFTSAAVSVKGNRQATTGIARGSITHLETRKQAFRDLHASLKATTEALAKVAAEHPLALVNKAHELIYFGGHYAAYQIGNSATRTAAEKWNWAKAAKAVLDGGSAATLYGGVALAPATIDSPIGILDPTDPTAAPDFAAPVDLSTNDYPDTATPPMLGDGAWIEDLT